MCMCNKCGKSMGWTVLIAGFLFLLKDLNVWSFWGIEPWTVVLILAGFAMMGKACCKDCCNGMCKVEDKPKAAKKKK